jgi:hypothetical protein
MWLWRWFWEGHEPAKTRRRSLIWKAFLAGQWFVEKDKWGGTYQGAVRAEREEEEKGKYEGPTLLSEKELLCKGEEVAKKSEGCQKGVKSRAQDGS